MFAFASRLIVRRPWLVVLGWAVLGAVLHHFAPRWDDVTRDDDVRLFPAGSPSVVGQDLLERGFPRDASSSQIVLAHERREGRLSSADFAHIDKMAAEFYEFARSEPSLGFKKMDTYRTPVIGPRLIGAGAGGEGQAALSIVSMNGSYRAKATRIAVDKVFAWLREKAPAPPDGLRLSVSGSAVVGHDINSAAKESISNTTTATIVLVVAILLVVYRSPLLAMVPLITIALSVAVSFWSIALLTKVPALGFQVINITKVFIIVVLFGAGTDYCLFLIARYSEELARGRARGDALRVAMVQVGGALAASAGTVIVGLGMLYFSSFAKIKFTGPTIALSLGVALAASLTLAPALLACLGGAMFWPFRVPGRAPGERTGQGEGGHTGEDEVPAASDGELEDPPAHGFWVRAADLVVARPLVILSVCLLALLPLAVVGARATSNYDQLADLDRDRPSVIGAEVIRRYFAVGELSPTTVLIDHPGRNFRTAEGRAAIEETTRWLSAIEYVAEVRSLTRPVGRPVSDAPPKGFFGQMTGAALALGAQARYVSLQPAGPADREHITRIDVVFHTDPFSATSMDSLEEVRAVLRRATAPGGPLEGARSVGFCGSTSMVNDLRHVTTSDERRMYVLVTLGVYTILVALLRRPGISLYLIFTVVLGYLASLGLTDLVFAALHQGPAPWQGLDWTVAFFLFVILVAVGEDYNIFLMSRVIEEERKHGATEGTRRAVAHTGGIISSCGLIMAGTFGAMLTGNLSSLRQLGFSLGLGVLLDTFLVRPILVPAFVVLLDRWRERRRAAADVPSQESLMIKSH